MPLLFEVAAFSRQVERYFSAFGRSRVHVIIHDDLLLDRKRVNEAALQFLGVDPSFVPDFAQRNVNKVPKSLRLQRLYYDSSRRSHGVAKRIIPKSIGDDYSMPTHS